MFKMLLVFTLVFSGSLMAQNMADKENYKDAYIDMPDGSSRYVGKCSTHEDYEKFYFKTKKVLQKYTDPSDLSEAQIKAILAKFDKQVISLVLKTLNMYEISNSSSEVSILKDYIDDITVESISSVFGPELDLIRFNVGVGGGNGSYMVFNKIKNGSGITYEMMSFTFDSELNYCDRKVWLQNSK
jgi:hypothetical protein